MGLITKPYTFSAGALIVASEHNANFDTIYNLVNGNIEDTNLSGSLSISDSKLAQITSASKVKGTALINLETIPSGAGFVPQANGGLSTDLSNVSKGSVVYFSSTGTATTLASGTSGYFLMATGTTSNSVYNSVFRATNIGANGYVNVGGFIIQWGSFSSNDASDTTVTFPVAFPTACYSVSLSLIGQAGKSNIFFLNSAAGTSSMSVHNYSGITTTCYWIAIGN